MLRCSCICLNEKQYCVYCCLFIERQKERVESDSHIDCEGNCEIFQDFITWNFDDYGLQIVTTQNYVSWKLKILHQLKKKKKMFIV